MVHLVTVKLKIFLVMLASLLLFPSTRECSAGRIPVLAHKDKERENDLRNPSFEISLQMSQKSHRIQTGDGFAADRSYGKLISSLINKRRKRHIPLTEPSSPRPTKQLPDGDERIYNYSEGGTKKESFPLRDPLSPRPTQKLPDGVERVYDNSEDGTKKESSPLRGPLSPRPTQKLPDGVERVYEESEYTSSESISFYSHKDTSFERRLVYGSSDTTSSIEFETEQPPNQIKPKDMVQILLTKAIDPYIAYKAVAADYEMEENDRRLEWGRLSFHAISVYRALRNFKTTNEEIYKSLKEANKLRLFTAPPKHLWKTLHDYDDDIVRVNRGQIMWWTKSTPKKVRSYGTVSSKDKVLIQNFKASSRDVARALKNKGIDSHFAYEILKVEKRMNSLERSMLYRDFKIKPDDIYEVLKYLRLSKEDIYKRLKYLSESLELFRKPLGSGPHDDGALNPQIYDHNLLLKSEEDYDVLQKYILPNFSNDKLPVVHPFTKLKKSSKVKYR